MIDVIYKGILIGVLVSAPLGPIGLLCIQRTLYKGRWHGFCSGIGAACSDFLYAMITGMGMGIVITFIEDNQAILQLAGSVLLMIFGIYIYRSDPSKSFRKPKHTYSYSQDILSAFVLTLSNPLIIFLFIALFARFNFISLEDKVGSIVLGMAGVLAGALAWWFAITSVIARLSKVFNERGLLIMNRTLGIIVLLLSLFGILLSLWELCPYA
ncbi:MAG: LysE family translocator [Dysgonamonadaceae bacterium]|jgi:threonine/homoserine/homoserine lactone efflux protein|nr:LysE family translocator [Dysgonamonadaceae bacterium]